MSQVYCSNDIMFRDVLEHALELPSLELGKVERLRAFVCECERARSITRAVGQKNERKRERKRNGKCKKEDSLAQKQNDEEEDGHRRPRQVIAKRRKETQIPRACKLVRQCV